MAKPLCAFCGRPESEAGRLVRGPKAAICADCTARVRELLGEEDLAPKLGGAPGGAPDARPAAPGAPPVAVIPARYGSTRFPGKPLALLSGRPMVQHVYEACVKSEAFSQVIVATDDERISLAVRGFGGEVVLTSDSCPSGTDRVAEVARDLPGAESFVNVQGDEPLVSPEALRLLSGALRVGGARMATLVRPLLEEERASPHVVKVVMGRQRQALYFSRADIPFERDSGPGAPSTAKRYAHVGLYGYRRDVLLKLSELPPTPLEVTEKLEQLRALEHGIPILCVETEHRSLGVDTPEDLQRVEAELQAGLVVR